MQQNKTDKIAPNADLREIGEVFKQQQQHQFVMGRTTVKERKQRLERLGDCLMRRRQEMEQAMWADFHKNTTEVSLSEMGVVMGEIRHTIAHLSSWMTPQKAATPLSLFGTSSEIQYRPKGVCLIISPWNFPFNLTFGPLVSAIAAGNCVILKPSEYTVHSSALMKSIVKECFPPEEVALFEGDAQVAKYLLSLPFNHIFFTGSPAVGKIVMTEAAKNLASVTLELGGKSPVIVDESADLDAAAARIAWIKALNVGQVCISPDYMLVHASVHDALVAKIQVQLETFFGKDTATRAQSADMCRMVSYTQFARVKSLLDDAVQRGATLRFGGHTIAEEKYIEPTLLTNVPEDAVIWKEEIFGPLLPIRTWTKIEDAIKYINASPRPLALYVFSRRNSQVKHIIRETHSGGVTVNDCAVHFYNPNIPFGGSNNSGIGMSHGKFGFLEFSHSRSVLRQNRIFATTSLMMPPYGGKLSKLLIEAVVKWF